MATSRALREQDLTVDNDVEYTLGPGDQGQLADDMLIVAEKITRRAHGTVAIVSRHAVGDRDRVLDHRAGTTSGRYHEAIDASPASGGPARIE